jgi:hypothetical protein
VKREEINRNREKTRNEMEERKLKKREIPEECKKQGTEESMINRCRKKENERKVGRERGGYFLHHTDKLTFTFPHINCVRMGVRSRRK